MPQCANIRVCGVPSQFWCWGKGAVACLRTVHIRTRAQASRPQPAYHRAATAQPTNAASAGSPVGVCMQTIWHRDQCHTNVRSDQRQQNTARAGHTNYSKIHLPCTNTRALRWRSCSTPLARKACSCRHFRTRPESHPTLQLCEALSTASRCTNVPRVCVCLMTCP